MRVAAFPVRREEERGCGREGVSNRERGDRERGTTCSGG